MEGLSGIYYERHALMFYRLNITDSCLEKHESSRGFVTPLWDGYASPPKHCDVVLGNHPEGGGNKVRNPPAEGG